MIEIAKLKIRVESLLDWVRKDYTQKTDKTETFLYRVLGGIKDDTYDFYEQSVAIFTRKSDTPYNLKVKFELPKGVADLPLIVIREPGRVDAGENTIGRVTQHVTNSDGSVSDIFMDSKKFTFDLMCISANTTESILISEVLYALLVGSLNTWASNYNKIDIGMKELISENNIVPYPLLFRTVTLTLTVPNFIPSIIDTELVDKVYFKTLLY